MHPLAAFLPRLTPRRPPAVETVTAALLLSDISGFTALTERLHARGRDGAEEIATVVSRAFTPAIRAIHRAGGSVASFGGDALFATFEGPAPVQRAVAAAEAIREGFARRGPVESSAGPVPLGIGQAVHHGALRLLHLGAPERRHLLAAGPAVSALARLGARAGTGALLLSAAARRRLGAERATGRARLAREGAAATDRPSLRTYLPPRIAPLLHGFVGEYRRTTVLFLETRGGRLVDMQRFYLRLAETLDRYDGLLLKTDLSADGTKWLCVFGLPAAHEEDPDRAARAALDVAAWSGVGVSIRGGMHAGMLANVVVGTTARRSFDVMGDVVNTAARALGRAAWGEVVVTEETQHVLAGVETVVRGEHRVKGKELPLRLHALLSARASRRAVRTAAPFVGREAELAALVRALERAREGSGVAIAIGGEAGLGKSRLKHEAAVMAAQMGFTVHEGRAVGFGGGPWWAIAEAIRSVMGLRDGADRAATLEAVRNICARLGLPDVERHHLADVLGARDDASPLSHLDGRTVRQNGMIAICRLAESLARERPRMVVIEDMHWADEMTREACTWLARAAAGSRVVLLLLHRPGYGPPQEAMLLPLGELPAEAIDALLAATLGQVPERVARLVKERAGGNPFYLEELARHLFETGLLSQTAAGYRLKREPQADDLPESIASVIAARLDRLSPEGKRVAQCGAVIGRSFPLALLHRMPAVPRQAGPGILELTAKGILLEKEREPPEYVFRHGLARDVAYASILASQRRQLHRAVADAIEELLGRERYLGMLGHHREEAGQRDAALEAYLAGARTSARAYAHEDAESLYGRFLTLSEGDAPARIPAWNELGRIYRLQGRMAEAEEEHRKALRASRATGSTSRETESARELGSDCRETGRMEEARGYYEEALALARASGDRRAEAETLGNLATLLRDTGHIDQAEAVYLDAMGLVRAIGQRALEAQLLGNVGSLRQDQGRFDESRELYEQALTIHREVGDRRFEGSVLSNLAALHYLRGAPDDAKSTFAGALALHRSIGNRRSEGIVLQNLALLCYEQGEVEQAMACHEQALAIHRVVANPRSEGFVLANLGRLHHEQGGLAEARAYDERALAILRAVEDRRTEGIVLANLANLMVDEGRLAEARGTFDEALAIHRATADRQSEGYALGGLAKLLSLLASPDAQATIELAEAVLTEVGDSLELGKLFCVIGHAALAEGRSASPSVARAGALVDKLPPGPRGQLAAAVARLERAVAAQKAGREVLRGHAAMDLTEGQLRCLRTESGGRCREATSLGPPAPR